VTSCVLASLSICSIERTLMSSRGCGAACMLPRAQTWQLSIVVPDNRSAAVAAAAAAMCRRRLSLIAHRRSRAPGRGSLTAAILPSVQRCLRCAQQCSHSLSQKQPSLSWSSSGYWPSEFHLPESSSRAVRNSNESCLNGRRCCVQRLVVAEAADGVVERFF